MRVKRIIFLLLIVGLAESAVASEWRKENSESLAWLHAVQFIDANNGFAAGSNGTLLVTRDSGHKWVPLLLNISDTIRDIHFLDRANGWLLCDRGQFRKGAGKNASYLMHTADSGATWAVVELSASHERFNRMFFAEGGEGYLIGEGGTMVGFSRETQPEPRMGLPLRYLMTTGIALGGSRIVLGGGGGSIITSDDSGQSWRIPHFWNARPESKVNSLYFLDTQRGWAAGNGGLILSTNDGGRSWRSISSNSLADIFDIGFFDSNIGFAVGDNGIILRTQDAGVSWTSENGVPKHRLERLAFAGSRAYAVGFGGTIISTELPRGQRH